MPLVITGHTAGVDAVVAGALSASTPVTISGSDTVGVRRTADGAPARARTTPHSSRS
jgi:hypothetical protein